MKKSHKINANEYAEFLAFKSKNSDTQIKPVSKKENSGLGLFLVTGLILIILWNLLI